MFNVRALTLSVLSIWMLALTACGSLGAAPQLLPTSAPTSEPTAVTDQAFVESIDLLMLESFPVQVTAVVRGQLPDACSQIDNVEQTREGNTFQLVFSIERRPDARCALVLTPFEHSLSLDVAGLKAGTYTVTAGGVSATFTLAIDNILQETPAPTPSYQDTTVKYVLALQDVSIRSGPDAAYEEIGQVASGQIALVTGVSVDGRWWRVICPDDTVGNCWVPADPQSTQPTTPPSF
jgi:hypothetical protein